MKWLKKRLRDWLFSDVEDLDKMDNMGDIGDVDDIDGVEDIDEDMEYSPQQIEIAQKFLGAINITILSDGQLFINCGWCGCDEHIAEVYGKFLFALNDGRLISNITSYLIDIGASDLKAAKFVTKILESWKKSNEEHNGSPIVCPTQTFRLNREANIEEE